MSLTVRSGKIFNLFNVVCLICRPSPFNLILRLLLVHYPSLRRVQMAALRPITGRKLNLRLLLGSSWHRENQRCTPKMLTETFNEKGENSADAELVSDSTSRRGIFLARIKSVLRGRR